MSNLDVFDLFNRDYSREQLETMSLRDWLLAARDDKMLYASPAERMISAIGEQELIDTAQRLRACRGFSSTARSSATGPSRASTAWKTRSSGSSSYFKHAAQGLEEKRQILYLLGPVGGGKSSLAERLKELMEKRPIYVLKANDRISPVFESPLGLFRSADLAALLEDKYGIERHRLSGVMSPWAVKRLDEFGGDISKFEVARLYPSKLRQIAVAKTEPGDDNNQDISALIGKVDIRKLEHFSPERPRRLRLLGRSLPRQPGPSRIRRDVQGADQGAASAADRDAGRQLHRHRNARSHSVQRHHPRALERGRVDSCSSPTRTTKPSSTASASSRCRTACASTEETKIYKKLLREQRARRRAVRAGDARDAGAVLRADAAQGARELESLLQDARL